ncbi:hypothetical protein FN846DRAFT_1023098 [Sphaerosporella brunnea]|uniref:C2H2-type domain-containing protein n=1 Tax=Sphaerosporella brunnea TaxID=1250544 RepID=A0A5J5EQV5_9PEZI|nr:hypothetical protein FN846DRAFT_1023098 [Sphaerosporella brunnea]
MYPSRPHGQSVCSLQDQFPEIVVYTAYLIHTVALPVTAASTQPLRLDLPSILAAPFTISAGLLGIFEKPPGLVTTASNDPSGLLQLLSLQYRTTWVDIGFRAQLFSKARIRRLDLLAFILLKDSPANHPALLCQFQLLAQATHPAPENRHASHRCPCSRSFSSRNTLFAHITEQNHWADVKDTGGGKTPYGAKLDDHPPNSNHDAAAAAGAKLHNRIPSKCRQCSRIFSSRNALFAHINEQNHWTNDDGGKGRVIQEQHRCGNCQRIFPSRGQLEDHWKAKHLPLTDQSVCNSGRAEGIDTTVSELGAHDDIYSGESPKGSIDEASEFDSEAYSGDEEERSDIDYGDPQLPPPKLSIYTKPFPGIENKDRKQRWQKFNAATNWDERYAIAVDMLLEPYLTKYKNVFSFWPQQELRTIFDDAVALPKLPTDPTRYFYNEFQTTCEPLRRVRSDRGHVKRKKL